MRSYRRDKHANWYVNSASKLCVQDLGRCPGSQWEMETVKCNNLEEISEDILRERETNEVATMWIKWTEIKLSEIRLTQKITFFIIPLMWTSRTGKTNPWWTNNTEATASLQEGIDCGRHNGNFWYLEAGIGYGVYVLVKIMHLRFVNFNYRHFTTKILYHNIIIGTIIWHYILIPNQYTHHTKNIIKMT